MTQEKPYEISTLESYLGKPFFKREIRIESPVYVGVYSYRPDGFREDGQPFGRNPKGFDTEGEDKITFLNLLCKQFKKCLENNAIQIGFFYKTKDGSLIREKGREYIRHEYLGEEIDRESNVVKNRYREQAINTIEIFNQDENALNQAYEEVKIELDKLEVIAEKEVEELRKRWSKICP